MSRIILAIALLCSWGCASPLQGQVTAEPAGSTLHFSRPVIVANLNAQPTVAGRFDCDDNGNVYTFIDGYAPNAGSTPTERLSLLAIHPDGKVTNFPWRSVSGFSDISLPRSVFVGYGSVYVLVLAKRTSSPGEPGYPFPLVLRFDLTGTLTQTTVLEQGLDPLALGIFHSGDIIVLSEDRLNHRTALDLIAKDGSSIRQLDLAANDYLAIASKETEQSVRRKYNSMLLLSMTKFYPFGDHLLLVPLDSINLPIIELGEHGVVKAITPGVPNGEVIESLISSSDSQVQVQLATIVQTSHPALDSEGNLLSVGTTPSQAVTELSFTDGRVIREIDIGSPAVKVACERQGVFRLLTQAVLLGSSRSLQLPHIKLERRRLRRLSAKCLHPRTPGQVERTIENAHAERSDFLFVPQTERSHGDTRLPAWPVNLVRLARIYDANRKT